MKILRGLLIFGFVVFLLVGAARVGMILSTQDAILEQDALTQTHTALVLGAGLTRSSAPTAPLKDRLDAAFDLYTAGKVKVLLLSGDNRTVEYNEPESMRRYLAGLGVPDGAMVLDYAGRRTYDSCCRAKAIFGQESLIIVTQRYHLYRALYLCEGLGIDSTGYAADRIEYLKRRYIYWNIREVGATLAAYWDNFRKPEPVLGDPLPIPVK